LVDFLVIPTAWVIPLPLVVKKYSRLEHQETDLSFLLKEPKEAWKTKNIEKQIYIIFSYCISNNKSVQCEKNSLKRETNKDSDRKILIGILKWIQNKFMCTFSFFIYKLNTKCNWGFVPCRKSRALQLWNWLNLLASLLNFFCPHSYFVHIHFSCGHSQV
jgi:hypothetical protein